MSANIVQSYSKYPWNTLQHAKSGNICTAQNQIFKQGQIDSASSNVKSRQALQKFIEDKHDQDTNSPSQTENRRKKLQSNQR
jgi:hypothetical protein